MMGTGPFAVPSFRGLLQTHHQVVLLVTSPVRDPAAPTSPMRHVALEHGIPIFDPASVNTPDARTRLLATDADLYVVCDYGQILSAETLATARLGGINLHASLLPKYRGAAPINWAIYDGETVTGVSVIHMTPRIDAGPVIAQGELAIDPEETAGQLEARLAEHGAWFIRRTIDSLEAGMLEALPQDPALASKAPRLKRNDGQVDWTRPAKAIKNQIRAFDPWPKTFTYWHRPTGKPLRLILEQMSVEEGVATAAAPGTVVEADKDRLTIATSEGIAVIHQLQPAGKKLLRIREFLNGHRVRPGDRFGPEIA
jgi:methionyl-tRNA formyltransferase